MVMNDISIRQTLPKYLQRYFLQLKAGAEPTINGFNQYLSCNAVLSELGEGHEAVAKWCANSKNLSDATLSKLLACTQNNLKQLESDLMDNFPLQESKIYWANDGSAVYYKTEILYLDKAQEFSLEDLKKEHGQVTISTEELDRVNKEIKEHGLKIELSQDGKKFSINAFNHSAQIMGKLPLNIVINGKRNNGDKTKMLINIKDIKDFPEEIGSLGKAGPWIAGVGGVLLSLFSFLSNSENKLNKLFGIIGGALIASSIPLYTMIKRKYSNLPSEKEPKNKAA